MDEEDLKCPDCGTPVEEGEFGDVEPTESDPTNQYVYFKCDDCQKDSVLYFTDGKFIKSVVSPENFNSIKPHNN